MKNVAIIGLGVSSAVLFNLLKNKCKITVFEKSRGAGGRVSTRKQEGFSFDHGAQYFTIRSQEMLNFCKPLIDLGSLVLWSPRYRQFDGGSNFTQKSDKEKRYVGYPYMNSFLKNLFDISNVKFNTKIKQLKKNNKWVLIDQDDNSFSDFDCVVFTAPAPQTALLLPSNVDFYHKVNSIKMNPCFSLMLGFDEFIDMGFDAASFTNSKLSWLALNSSKPGRVKKNTIVAHSTVEYASLNLLKHHSEIIKELSYEIDQITDIKPDKAIFKNLHLWRYSISDLECNAKYFYDDKLNVYACGDWCYGNRVEGAFLSAYYLAKKLGSL